MSSDLLVIVNWRDSTHPQRGGAELFCERVAEEAGRHGRRVVLLTSQPGGQPAYERRTHYDVHRAGGTYGVYFHSLLWLLRHRRHVKAVLDSQNGIPFFTPLALRRSTPVLLLMHHVHQQQFSEYFGPVMATIGRFLEGPASRWIYGRRTIAAVSPSTASEIRRTLRYRGDVVVVPCGMDAPPTETSPDAVDLRSARAATPTVVVVGRLVAHKRLDQVVRAMVHVRTVLPGTRLHVIGDGPARADLEALAKSIGPVGPDGSTTFHGRVDDRTRDGLLRSAWLTVSASPGEGWGLSVLEANAAGIPAVAYRVSGLRDSVVPGRTGWLVDPGAGLDGLASTVAAALRQLTDPEVAEHYADDARAWAEHFTWTDTATSATVLLQQEGERLRLRSRDRRRLGWATTWVEVPADALDDGWRTRVRRGELWMSAGALVRGILRGCSEDDAFRAADRLGVGRELVVVGEATPADELGAWRVWRRSDTGRAHDPGQPTPGAGRDT